MLLCEEYAQRHHFDVPFVRYTDSGSLFLNHKRREYDADWLVLYFFWETEQYHPGHYRFYLGRPLHNGQDDPFYFFKDDTCLLAWDQYEDHLLSFVSDRLKEEAVCDTIDVTLAAWSMFLLNYDGWFAQKIHPNVLYQTIDEDLPSFERYLSLQELLSYLSESHRSVYSSWHKGMLNHITNYSYWLGELVKVNGK